MKYVLGLDISTTSAKALLVDSEGRVVAQHSTPQPISHPYPLWSEQNPEDWWDGIVTSIRALLTEYDPEQIVGIGLTGQMHGLVCLDEQGEVLRPAILWNDQRTQAECDWITEQVGAQRLIELTGNRALTGFTAPKIIWLRRHEPEVYAKIAHILLPKDYIRFKLTGEYDTDLAGAAGTLLLDVKKRQWSQEVLSALDIPLTWMPKVHEGTEITGMVQEAAAAKTGLLAGTPIVGGAGDQAAGAVGVGAIEHGTISLVLGTSGVVFAPLKEYAFESEGRLHAFCHALPNTYHFMGVMLSAAGSLQWYHDALAPDTSFDSLLHEAVEISVGADGLFFLPYLTGERTPHPDPLARGAFIGLTARHQRGHITRAVLEGIAFGLKDCFDLLTANMTEPIHEVRVSGGGARSELWLQILANVLNMPLTPVQAIEGAAYGAALLAGIGVGLWPDHHTITSFIAVEEPIRPDASSSKYQQLHHIYTELYPTLKQTFAMLAHL